MTWNPLNRRTPIGIDVTTRHLHAVQLTRTTGKRWRLAAALSLPRAEGADALTDEEVRQLAEVLPRRDFQGDRVVLCMPGEHVITEVFRSSELKNDRPDVRELGSLIAKAHRCDANALECASWSLPASRPRESSHGLMAVACRHDHADHYLDVVERHDLQVCGLDVRCQAMRRACADRAVDTESLAALVDLGWSSARLVVLCGSVVVFERTLGDCGLNRLEMNLTGRLGLDQDVAEFVLNRVGLGGVDADSSIATGVMDEVRNQVQSYVQRLINELKRSFSYAVQEYPDRCFSLVALVGDGADMPGLTDPIGTDLGVQALVVAPADLVECPDALRASARSPMLTVATGLAMYERG